MRPALQVAFITLLSFGGVEVLVRSFDLFRAAQAATAAPVAELEAAGTETPTTAAATTSQDLGEAGPPLRLHPLLGFARSGGTFQGIQYNELGPPSRLANYRTLGSDRFVVGVLGGSVASGTVVLGAPLIVQHLESRFPALRGRVEVVNLAHSAYKQPQQLIALEQALLLGIQLDAVINLDGYNEVGLGFADVQRGQHPLLPISTHWKGLGGLGSGLVQPDQIRWAGAALEQRDRARAWQTWIAGSLARHSAVARTIVGTRILAARAAAAAAEEKLASLAPASDALFFSLEEPCLANQDCWALLARLWQESSAMIDAVCRQRGLVYLHALQPNQYLEGSKPLSAEEREKFFDLGPARSQGARQGYPKLIEAGQRLREQGVDFQDLSGLFRDHPETLYRDACCHYQPAGYRLVAARLAEHLGAALERRGMAVD